MALFARIFNNRKQNLDTACPWGSSHQNKPWPSAPLESDQIRLVLYRDHELKRSVLFDSNCLLVHQQNQHAPLRRGAVARRPPPAVSQDSVGSPSPSKYTFTRQSSDTKMLGEMIFGSGAMKFRGSTLKVHTMRTPPQLMVTKVFQATVPAKDTGDAESFDSYSLPSSSIEYSAPKQISGSDQNVTSIAHSIPVDVPSSPLKKGDNEDSGISASVASSCSSLGASFPSPGSSGSMTSGSTSLHSLQRRWLRNQHTSLEHNLRKRLSDEGTWEPMPAHKRSPKIGIGIIFSLKEEEEDMDMARRFQNFFFSHITLLESHVNKLGVHTEKAYLNKKAFIPLVVDALSVFRQSICDLYAAPRLSEPVWISMMSQSTHKVALCQRFLKEFMITVDRHDTKNTKFFLSTLLTAALTHHLAWVPTVTPAGATPSRTYLDKHSAKWLDALAKSHPYNPLWAQLGDLYGAIGFPLRQSRTVVVGKKAEVVKKLLYVLSYFIRCSEIQENLEIRVEGEASPVSPQVVSCHPGEMTPITESALSRENSKKTREEQLGEGNKLAEMRLESLGSLLAGLPGVDGATCLDSMKQVNNLTDGENRTLNCACRSPPDGDSEDFASPETKSADVSLSLSECRNCSQDFVSSAEFRTITSCVQYEEAAADISDEASLIDFSDSLELRTDPCNGDATYTHKTCDTRNSNSQPMDSYNSNTSDPSSLVLQLERDAMDMCPCETNDVTSAVEGNQTNCELPHDCSSCSGVGATKVFGHEGCQSAEETTVSAGCERRTSQSDCCSSGESSPEIAARCASPVVAKLAAEGEVSIIKSGDSTVIKTKYGGRFPMFFTVQDPVGQTDSSNAVFDAGVTSQTDAGESEQKCQVSPTEVAEDSRRLRVRSVGRSSVASPSLELPSGEDGVSCAKSPVHYPGEASRKLSGDGCIDLLLAGDSGCYDGTSGEVSSQNSPNTSRKDSGTTEGGTLIETGSNHVAKPSETAKAPVKNQPDKRPLQRVCFERSNSMFNEYFETDEMETDLLLPLDKSLTVKPTGLTYKRLSSVEGSNSIFDEYMNEPVPELASIKASGLSRSSSALSDPNFTECLDDGIGGEGDLPTKWFSEEHTASEPRDRGDAGTREPSHQRPTSLPLSARKLTSPLTVTLTRQNSIPGRCRPVTPTELGRRRHASSLSTTSSMDGDFFLNLQEVSMPGSEVSEGQSLDYSFGRSLMGGFSEHYLSDFALHGTSDPNYLSRLHNDLTMAVQNSVLDEPIAEAVAVVADTDKWSVRLMRCQYATATQLQCEEIEPSPLIGNIIESVRDLWKLKMSPEFCLMHLEDRLQEIYFKSRMLAEYIYAHKSKYEPAQLAAMLGFDKADLPLLLAVAGTHTPLLSMGLR